MTFSEFAEERAGSLLRYATVLCCDPHLAQDIVQEVLLRAAGRWERIGALDQPAAYVKRMVTNEYLSWRRRREVRDITASHQTLDGLGPRDEDPMRRYDERDSMLAMIATLPPKQRAAVVLRYYEGYSDTEIAEAIGCGQTTVRTHLHRALRALRVDAGGAAVMSARYVQEGS